MKQAAGSHSRPDRGRSKGPGSPALSLRCFPSVIPRPAGLLFSRHPQILERTCPCRVSASSGVLLLWKHLEKQGWVLQWNQPAPGDSICSRAVSSAEGENQTGPCPALKPCRSAWWSVVHASCRSGHSCSSCLRLREPGLNLRAACRVKPSPRISAPGKQPWCAHWKSVY